MLCLAAACWCCNQCLACDAGSRYLGVSVLEGCKPAIVMKLYDKGSLREVIEASQGKGLELQQALRWGRISNLWAQ